MLEYPSEAPKTAGALPSAERIYTMKAIVTVIGKDHVGIIAAVCALLSGYDVNILNISQSILQEYFVMVMLVDLTNCQSSVV